MAHISRLCDLHITQAFVARNPEGKIAAIKILFISFEEDEEEE